MVIVNVAVVEGVVERIAPCSNNEIAIPQHRSRERVRAPLLRIVYILKKG